MGIEEREKESGEGEMKERRENTEVPTTLGDFSPNEEL